MTVSLTRNVLLVAMAFAVVVGGTACTSPAIKKNTLSLQGVKMRKTAAFRTQILQVGDKVSAGVNAFSSYDQLLVDKLPATVSSTLIVDEVRDWITEIGLEGIPKVAEASGSFSSGRKNSGKFVVVAIQNKQSLLEVLQDKRNRPLVEQLLRMKKPRLITAVATTLDHKSVSTSKWAGNLPVALTTIGLPVGKVNVKASDQRSSTLQYSAGTVFAYEMSIPAWSRNPQNPQQLIITDYVEDRPGVRNPKTIKGSWLDPEDVP